jgi:thiamine-monophosphate kinase
LKALGLRSVDRSYRVNLVTGEFRLIDALAGRFPAIGDDAAVVGAPRGPLLLATDAVVAGVHADLGSVGLDDLGWRAVVANVSDIAAMGGRPLHLLVSVAAPAETQLDLLFDGIDEAAREYGCEVVGGDLTNAPSLVVAVSVTGTVPDGGAPVLRSGASVGDDIYVSGPLGGAAASGWRARPQARVQEGERARLGGATAMIDVSDGLAADLNHLADSSSVGVDVAEGDVPVAEGATLEQALGGGEDYGLVFTAPPSAMSGLGWAVRIGVCTGDVSQRMEPAGWEHRFG